MHDNVRNDILEGDGVDLSDTVTRWLVEPLVRLTYGADIAKRYCPTFTIQTQREDDVAGEFGRFKDLVDRGVGFNADDARRRFTKLQRPEEGAPLVLPLDLVKVLATTHVNPEPEDEEDDGPDSGMAISSKPVAAPEPDAAEPPASAASEDAEGAASEPAEDDEPPPVTSRTGEKA